MWVQHYRPTVLHHEIGDTRDVVIAEHNGYQTQGVTHRRELSLDKSSGTLRIIDNIVLERPGEHTLDVPFHVHPSVSVDATQPGAFVLKTKGARGRDRTPR